MRGGVTMGSTIWLAVRIAAAVALVIVPFGYAITGEHYDVWIGVGCGLGCGLVIGVGVGLRGGARGGPWAGIPIGSIVGIVALLIGGLWSYGFGVWARPFSVSRSALSTDCAGHPSPGTGPFAGKR